MKILITAKYVSGSAHEGGSSRFLRLVGDTLKEMGHEVVMSDRPQDHVMVGYDLIICSHVLDQIKANPARKICISHGIIRDEAMRPGADRYISVSEEVRRANCLRGIESEVIGQPIKIGDQIRPGPELKKILIVRRAAYTTRDPFAFLSEKYEVRYSDPAQPIEDQIAWADLCIVLGRGALESMAQGKPVLIADNREYIGALGDGYITKENIKEIAKNNFSGRRFKVPLTREWIEAELAKYDPADSDFLRDYVIENHDARKIVGQYLSEAKAKQIHLIIPFWRRELKDTLIETYRPMGIILHPIMFRDEETDFNEPWIFPVIIPVDAKDCQAAHPGTFKRNWFIEHCSIDDGDYYVTVDDDDMYEAGVFDAIKQANDDIVIVSMKRGDYVPKDAAPERRYPTYTLYAHPDNIRISGISGQQSFVLGKIFKDHTFDEMSGVWDGKAAIHHRESGEQIAYRPDLFALFNFYEPGRWEKGEKGWGEGLRISFGVMVNDPLRLDMVLHQSQFPKGTRCHTLSNPDSATKGLNKLLGIIRAEGAEVSVLTHQDMFYPAGWIEQIREQIAKLPDSWVVAGIIGKDMNGMISGRFHDMRVPLNINTTNIHKFPHPACCMDECCIIVNLKKGFRFDEGLTGFDLYGTLACLQAVEQGGTAWILDAFAEHYCMRPFTWCPDDSFCQNYKWLFDRFKEIERVDSTALGLPKGQVTRELIFETSAAC